jgi:hypothetical protein
MPNRTRKNSRSGQIQVGAISKTKASLQDLPVRKKELLSLQEAIDQLRVPLKAALTKGYSYCELVDLLKQKGISISVSTLRSYLTPGRQQKSRTIPSYPQSNKSSQTTSEKPNGDVEVFIPSKTEIYSYTVGNDFWSAYQKSLKEREEVYRHLAES